MGNNEFCLSCDEKSDLIALEKTGRLLARYW